jgi:phage shock protein C
MFCNICGKAIQDDANLCPYCGHRVGTPRPRKALMRSRTDRKAAGVCAGLAQYAELDVTLVRVLWAVVVVMTGFVPGILAYVIAWIVMPEEPVVTAPVVTQQVANP